METATEAAPRLDAKQLLAPFVGANDVRSWLNNPFSIGGDLLASNGSILVCVTGAGSDAHAAPPDQKLVYALYEKATKRNWEGATIHPDSVKPIGDAHGITCRICAGRGRIIIDWCGDCDGEGTFQHGLHDYDCKECNATGYTHTPGDEDICPECIGSGIRSYVSSTVRHGDLSIAYRYIKHLKQLPDCVIDPVIHDGDSGFWFLFTGGWGLVMPVRV